MNSVSRFVAVALGTVLSVAAMAQEVIFERDVYPIFQKRCSGCHFPDADRLRSGLDLSTAATAVEGGFEGVSIIPGNVDGSILIGMLEWTREPEMPPSDKFEKLPEAEIAIIKEWIRQGAPSDASLTPVVAAVPGDTGSQAIPTGDIDAPIGAMAFATAGDALYLAKGTLHRVDVVAVDPVTGDQTPRHTLDGHAEMVRALAYSPDGTLLAAAGGKPGRSGEVKLWLAADGAHVKTIDAHRDTILAVTFSPDGQHLATGSYDKTAAVWDVATGSRVHLLDGHVDAVHAVAFSPNGELIATGAGDRTVKIWDMETGELSLTITDSQDSVLALAFSPATGYLAGAGIDKIIRVWDIGGGFQQTGTTAGTLIQSTFAHDSAVLRLIYSPDGKHLFSTSEDRRIKMWDAVTLHEELAYPPQSDWVTGMALSPDGRLLAAGRYDATHTVYLAEEGIPADEGGVDIMLAALPAPGTEGNTRLDVAPVIIEATVPPVLNSISPGRWHRGSELDVTIAGKNLDGAEPYFTNPAITAEIIESEALPIPEPKLEGPRGTGADIFDNAQPYRLKLKLTIADDAPVGNHSLMFRTPIGLSNARGFEVIAAPDVAEEAPEDGDAQAISWPAVVSGRIQHSGEVDRYRVNVTAGDELVFVLTDTSMTPLLRLLSHDGGVLASSGSDGWRWRERLGHRFEHDGEYFLEVSDIGLGAGRGYRLHVGQYPFVTYLWPLGVEAGGQREVHAKGFNLGTAGPIAIEAPEGVRYGRTERLPIPSVEGSPIGVPSIAMDPFPVVDAVQTGDGDHEALSIPFPSTVNGRIGSPGATDDYRFEAKAGETIIIETMAARLGNLLDSYIEILDADGNPLERGVIRCEAQTVLALSGRDSRGSGIRLDSWRDLTINDYVMIGSEIIRVRELPGYADEDVLFRAFANGQRRAYFGTTPEHHAVDTVAYKVTVHPPGATFAPNGMPVFTLYWRNDDGFFGDGDANGDSLLEFTAPHDGTFIVRVSDAMGRGGEHYGYRLTLRPPEPDFDVVVSPFWVNVAQGSRVPVTVRIRRHDGFDKPVNVRIENLPEGFRADPGTVLAGEMLVRLALEAGPGAASTALDARFTVVGESEVNGEAVSKQTSMGAITVSQQAPDLVVNNGETKVAIAPADSGWVSVHLDRNNGYNSRTPIDVLNLPFGVRVLDTGLNGILVREGEHDRRMELYAEPWVRPMTRTIYIQARIETPSASNPVFLSQPIELTIGGDRPRVASSH